MKQLDCRLCLGVYGKPKVIGQVMLDGPIVDGSASMFSSLHILAMDRHFDEYVDQPVVQYFQQTHGIYTPSPQVRIQSAKQTANDITGSIGESLAAIVCRDILKLPSAAIEPLCVYKRLKTPDFRISWDASNHVGLIAPNFSSSLPTLWPLEAKMRKPMTRKAGLINAALAQLAAYWFYRGAHEPSCVGFGLIAAYVNGSNHIDVHMFLPAKQAELQEIRAFCQRKKKPLDFIKRFHDGSYELEACIETE